MLVWRIMWRQIVGLLTVSLWAQTDLAILRVVVTDPTEAAVPAAQVTLRDENTNRTVNQGVSGDGYATFPTLLPGTYSVTVNAPGFRQTEVRGLVLNVAERRLLRVSLSLTGTAESVDVKADAAVIQGEEASLGQVIKGAVAVELPLAGRRYTELAFLVPGASPSTANVITRGVGWFVSNGNFHTMNNFQIDGFDNNQGTFNMQALSAQVVQPSPDALAEFKVQTNSYSAEFGRSSGAVINVSIKSGTNGVHGSAWYYNRDDLFGANSWNGNLIGAEKAKLKWHQMGGTIGGPVKKDKLFYFGHYEGFVRLFADNFLTTVPTAGQRQGVFAFNVADPAGAAGALFPNRTIPASRYDVLGKKLLDLFPAGNLAGTVNSAGRTVGNYGVQRDGREDTHKFDIRKDWYATGRDRVFGRLSFFEQDIYRDAILPGAADGSGDQGRTFNRNYNTGVAWNRVITPSIVNEFRAGYNRTNAFFTHATVDGISGTDFGFRGIPEAMRGTGGLPLIDFNNYNDLGTRNFRPNTQLPVQYQFLDTLSWNKGRHTIKSGFEFRWKRNDWLSITRRTPAYNVRGRFTNDDIGDLLLGLPEQLLVNTTPVNETLQQVYAGFAQDDWKVSRNVTLNLGVRYEYATPYYGLSGNPNKNFDPRTGDLVRATGDDKYLVTRDRNNFGPRLGVAWQLRPDRLVLRAAYGTFYSGEDF
ncbi:MAG: TonB-dependent receptor, partial [Bryobacteraceae bacterium]|nr:TonB-dependent receptor [Bryobacteraceae bacterium]